MTFMFKTEFNKRNADIGVNIVRQLKIQSFCCVESPVNCLLLFFCQ